ncbi:MAG: F0F1 ATP synthase subunit A [Syntrophaceae bacterium]
MDHGILLLNPVAHAFYEATEKILAPVRAANPGWASFLTDTNHYVQVVYMWFYMIVLILLAILAVKTIKLVPGRLQNFLEVVIGGLKNLLIDTMGENGMRFFPLIATLAIFILTANLGGIIPSLYSPTASMCTNAAMAIVVFLLTHIVGVQIHGIKYFKHFLGPVWWMAPIMLPIELIGHLARPLSLTMRLFGNIAGEDLVLVVILLLVPFLVPLPMLGLMIFTSVLQAFVFSLLAMMYISGAMEEAH